MAARMSTPPPTTDSVSDPASWSAANLTAVAIEREAAEAPPSCPTTFQRFTWRRPPRIGRALRFGLGALVLPILGPLGWHLADAELAAIDAGHVANHGRRWIRLARLCAIAGTCVLVSGTVALLIAIA
jgi:hypothetical protein